MPSSTSKLLTRKKKAPQQVRKGSKTFRHNKKLRQNISAKKQYTKGKKFRRVARGFVDKLRQTMNIANRLEEPCPICLEQMSEEENTTTLECNHRFHTNCLKDTIRKDTIHKRNVCPICIQAIGSHTIRELLSDSPEDMLIVAELVLKEEMAKVEASRVAMDLIIANLTAIWETQEQNISRLDDSGEGGMVSEQALAQAVAAWAAVSPDWAALDEARKAVGEARARVARQ